MISSSNYSLWKSKIEAAARLIKGSEYIEKDVNANSLNDENKEKVF